MIGKRNTRITIRDFSEARNDGGGVDPTWSDVRTVWGHVRSLSGREITAGGGLVESGTHAVTLDFFDGRDVSTDQRIIVKPEHGQPDRVMRLHRIVNPDLTNRSVVLYASHLTERQEAAP